MTSLDRALEAAVRELREALADPLVGTVRLVLRKPTGKEQQWTIKTEPQREVRV